MTHSSVASSYLARVRSELDTSEPASGSDTQNAATFGSSTRAVALRDPLAELLAGARGEDRGDGERRAHDRHADAGVAPEQLLVDDRQHQAGLVGVELRERLEAVEADLRRLLDQRPRRLLALVPLGRRRADDVRREAVDPLAHVELVLTELQRERALGHRFFHCRHRFTRHGSQPYGGRGRHGTAAVAERAAALVWPGRIGADRRRRRRGGRCGSAASSLLAEAAWRDDDVLLRAHAETEDAAQSRWAGCASCSRSTTTSTPFHRAHRSDPLLGRMLKARPKLRRAAQARAVRGAGVGGDRAADRHAERAGNIAWAFTRRHGVQRHARPVGRADAGAASPTRPRSRRPASRPRRRGRWRAWPGRSRRIDPAVDDQRELDAIPGVGEWTLGQLDLFGRGRSTTCRWPRTSACATPTRAWPACAPAASPRTEFAAVLDRYAPFQGLAAMYSSRRAGVPVGVGQNHRACPTSPLRTDTTRCPTAAAGAAASSCPRSASACGTASATTRRCRTSARSSAARSISASRTSTSPTTTARPTAPPS